MLSRTLSLSAAIRKTTRPVGVAKAVRSTSGSTSAPSVSASRSKNVAASAAAAAATNTNSGTSATATSSYVDNSSRTARVVSASSADAKKPFETGLKRERVARLVRQATADVRAVERRQNASVGPSGSLSQKAPEDDAFTRLLDNFHVMTAPFSDLDEVLSQERSREGATHSEPAAVAMRKRAASIVTCRDFNASLVCPKKFYLMSARPDLEPGSSIGEAVHLDDGVGFNELARRWDRLQFGSKAVLISDVHYDAAVKRTEEVLIDYFTHQYASLGEQAPTLTLHRPAFSATLQPDGARPGSPALTLRARPCVVRYRPKENQWVILESQAILDPLNTSMRAALILQRLHFTMLTLRRALSQPHIPIAVRKRFLDVDPKMLTEASLNEGHELVSGARPVAPIDVKRSGLLHIRQFMPGPVTLMDCEPTRLVKYVQRLSLEELLEADRQSYVKATGGKRGAGGRGNGSADAPRHAGATSGAFDLQQLDDVDPAVTPYYNAMVAAMKLNGKPVAAARSTRTLRARENMENQLFEAQQQLLEALLLHHTLKVVEKSAEAKQVARWTSFSRDTTAGLATSTWDKRADDDGADSAVDNDPPGASTHRKRRGKHAAATPLPLVPCFSEHVGTHCSRGDGCPFFAEGFCLPQRYPDPLKAQDNHLFTLPSTSVAKKTMWWGDGSRTVRDALYLHKSGAIKLTAPQLRYVKAVSQGQVAICPKEVDAFFSKLRYPLFVIDFEAVQFALPPFEKVVAYQSVPFQFSLDVFQHDVFTETPTHYDYLHFGPGYSPNVDPRPGCVKELLRIVREEREKKRLELLASGALDALREAEEAEAESVRRGKRSGGGARQSKKTPNASSARSGRTASVEAPLTPWDGTFIAHFASFEKSCLEKLGQLEEAYKEEIRGFYFLDTLDLFKKGFVHPNANGSNSLKKLLPAICPDFKYGVFGVEAVEGSGSAAAGEATDEGSQSDEQKGENAMAVYRMWYHQEGGGTLQDLKRAGGRPALSASSTSPTSSAKAEEPAVSVLPVLKDTREEVWARLRIQLLEYCSLDTRALYEIMREVQREREAVRGMKSEDKTGWIFVKPLPREIQF